MVEPRAPLAWGKSGGGRALDERGRGNEWATGVSRVGGVGALGRAERSQSLLFKLLHVTGESCEGYCVVK